MAPQPSVVSTMDGGVSEVERTNTYKDPTEEESVIARRNYDRYLYCKEKGHEDFCKSADVFDQYYRGAQWDDAARQVLEKQKRPAITVNLVFSTINGIVGEYTARRAEFQFKPTSDGASQDTAMVLTKVAMAVCDACDYEYNEGDAFFDSIITGRGYLDVRIDTTHNQYGEIIIEALDPRTVIPDPMASSYDPSKWQDVIVTSLASLDEIESQYGEEAAAKLKGCINAGNQFTDDSVIFSDEVTFGGDSALDAEDVFYSTDAKERRRVRGVRIIDRQYWRMGTFMYFIDELTGDKTPIPSEWTMDRAQKFAAENMLVIEKRIERRVRWTVSADNVLLFDGWSPYATFTVVPLFAYFRRGTPIGVVQNIIDPQNVLNKSTSQILHILNTTANSGWIVEEGSLSNMSETELENDGAKTGLVIVHKPGTTAPTKILPNQIPTGLTNAANMATAALREISGVNADFLGLDDSGTVSGVAKQTKTARTLAQLQPVMDNLARSRKMVGKKILELVQKFYRDERTFMIADYRVPTAPMEPMVVNKRTVPDGEQIPVIHNNLRLGKYDVVVSTMPARDRYEESQMAEMISMREAGVSVPDYRVIEYSNLHRKDEIAAEVQRLQGMAPPTEEEAQLQEAMAALQQQLMLLDAEERNAKVDLLTAQTALAYAKAYQTKQEPELEQQRLQLEAGIVAAEQATRERVNRQKELSAQLQTLQNNRVKLMQTRITALSKVATDKKPPQKAKTH